jgi:hypothetical protein
MMASSSQYSSGSGANRLHLKFFLQMVMLQNGFVHQVLQADLVVALDLAIMKHPLAVLATNIQVSLQNNPSLSNGAGLVGAEHVYGAEVLNGV